MKANKGKLTASLAWMYSGMAIRMSQGLGLFRGRYPSHLPWWIRERCRRIVWADFIIDRLTSAFADRASLLKEYEVAQAPLPSTDAAWQAAQYDDINAPLGFNEHGGLITEGVTSSSIKSYSTQLISLSRVLGRILDHVAKLSSQEPTALSNKQFLLGGDADTADDVNSRDLADLDAQLFRWRSRVPAHLLPPPPHHAPSPTELNREVAFLWMYYATCVCTLHRPHAVKDLRKSNTASVSFEACRVAAVDATRAIEWLTSPSEGMFINGSPYQFVCVIQVSFAIMHFEI